MAAPAGRYNRDSLMPTLLLEIGVEELPASMVDSASSQLADGVAAVVRDCALGAAAHVERYGTPRRLIVLVQDVAESQQDRTERRRGPSAKAAFKDDGSPTPALEGFARGAGVRPADVVVEGEYVYAEVSLKGKPAVEALAEPLASAVKSISFDKTMRWGAGRTRFSRPIRWIVALLGDAVIPLQIETATAGSRSRGHRFLSPEEFEANPSTFIDDLRQRFVEPDMLRRMAMIELKAREEAAHVVLSDELLLENANLTEWPMPIRGEFRKEFQVLPEAVLVTAMAKHERFFPVAAGSGISTYFVSVTNAGEPETVREGNEWVLNARLNDALFFYEEDSRKTIEDFLEATDRIVFQEKLGTILQRSERLAKLARKIASDLGFDADQAAEAARLCKADLATGLVSELPSLQGKVGGEYARRSGAAEAVCEAIASHYAPSSGNWYGGDEPLGDVVLCADQADRLAGYLGIGEVPSGSSDPYALRRAVSMMMETDNARIADWVDAARAEYAAQGFELQDATEDLKELMYGRYEAIYSEIPYDALAAAWATNWREAPEALTSRARLLGKLSEDIEFVRTAKRPGNILQAAAKKDLRIAEEVDTSAFADKEEGDLYNAGDSVQDKRDLEDFVDELRKLKPAIDAYFDKVMVMVDDEKLRANRLATLAQIDRHFRRIGDFSKIVIEEA